MTTTTIRRLAAALLSLVAVAALAGCTTPGAVKKACGTEADLLDTTGSTAGFRGQWPVELTLSAHDALVRGDRYYASTFTSGQGTVGWPVNVDGCNSPETRPRKHALWANETTNALGPRLSALTHARTHGGSDPLAALEEAAKLPHLTEVRIWSDLILQDDGVDLSKPVSKATVDRLVREWTPRLAGLKGVRVMALHAGRGVDSDVAVRQSEDLLRTVLERNGATLEWAPVLGR
jgi:hypothetical protein